jgi:primosomal protein N' (replication factor Y)
VNSPGAQRRSFCYAVPPNISLEVGHAVEVPFGPRLAQGVVLELTDYPAVEDTREIIALIDPRPVLSPPQVELALWISEYYLSPLFDTAALMVPPAFERKVLTFLSLAAEPDAGFTLSPEQEELLNLIREKEKVEIAEVEKDRSKKKTRAIIRQLMQKGLVDRTYKLEQARVRPKTIPRIHLAIEADKVQQEAERLCKKKSTYKQAKLLELLKDGPILLEAFMKWFGFTDSVVAALRRKGLVAVEQVQVYRDPLANRDFPPSPAPTLTPAQQTAWNEVKSALATEIYLRALEQAIAIGRRAIVLVPEIALTPQTISRFASRFPGRVGVLHSKLSVGEQFDEWWRIKQGDFDVVIGSRGAIFAPQPELGLIVIDEEHEWTYKQQEQTPRYHARDVALRLAELTGAVVILGSATPDVISYYRGQRGNYRLLELPERISTGEKRVQVVDLRQELKEGNRSIFSRSLTQGIDQALKAREQVILFLNRRGSATFVQCRDCGHVLRCRRCDVSLTYHSAREDLVCHQCNYRMAVPHVCPQCGGKRIKFLGTGIQKVEEELGRAFPQANMLRWDRDVTAGKYSHEDILDRFVSHEADVLIGTQMIAKGLDLPLVTLVGVINADVSLHLPDFRSGERTFQILTQVAGRAGRGPLGGQVIVQSYTPEHYAVSCAVKQDYLSFYEKESSLRRQYQNPPFSRLTRLLYTNPNNALCQREAQRMHCLLRGERDSWGMDVTFIGPSPAFIKRVRGRYRWQIILRGDDPVRLLAGVPIPQGWVVDIDPVSLL